VGQKNHKIYIVKLWQNEEKEAKRGERKKLEARTWRKRRGKREKERSKGNERERRGGREKNQFFFIFFLIPSNLPPLEYKACLNRLTTKP
jgi:hypothetical protein